MEYQEALEEEIDFPIVFPEAKSVWVSWGKKVEKGNPSGEEFKYQVQPLETKSDNLAKDLEIAITTKSEYPEDGKLSLGVVQDGRLLFSNAGSHYNLKLAEGAYEFATNFEVKHIVSLDNPKIQNPTIFIYGESDNEIAMLSDTLDANLKQGLSYEVHVQRSDNNKVIYEGTTLSEVRTKLFNDNKQILTS